MKQQDASHDPPASTFTHVSHRPSALLLWPVAGDFRFNNLGGDLMTDMIEKVARAIAESAAGPAMRYIQYAKKSADETKLALNKAGLESGLLASLERDEKYIIDQARVLAKAALTALQEPTAGMVEAGRAAFFDLTGDGKYKPFEKEFSDGFSAAIKHILEEGESE